MTRGRGLIPRAAYGLAIIPNGNYGYGVESNSAESDRSHSAEGEGMLGIADVFRRR